MHRKRLKCVNMNPTESIQARQSTTLHYFFHKTSYFNNSKRIDGTDFDFHVMTTSPSVSHTTYESVKKIFVSISVRKDSFTAISIRQASETGFIRGAFNLNAFSFSGVMRRNKRF